MTNDLKKTILKMDSDIPQNEAFSDSNKSLALQKLAYNNNSTFLVKKMK